MSFLLLPITAYLQFDSNQYFSFVLLLFLLISNCFFLNQVWHSKCNKIKVQQTAIVYTFCMISRMIWLGVMYVWIVFILLFNAYIKKEGFNQTDLVTVVNDSTINMERLTETCTHLSTNLTTNYNLHHMKSVRFLWIKKKQQQQPKKLQKGTTWKALNRFVDIWHSKQSEAL